MTWVDWLLAGVWAAVAVVAWYTVFREAKAERRERQEWRNRRPVRIGNRSGYPDEPQDDLEAIARLLSEVGGK